VSLCRAAHAATARLDATVAAAVPKVDCATAARARVDRIVCPPPTGGGGCGTRPNGAAVKIPKNSFFAPLDSTANELFSRVKRP